MSDFEFINPKYVITDGYGFIRVDPRLRAGFRVALRWEATLFWPFESARSTADAIRRATGRSWLVVAE